MVVLIVEFVVGQSVDGMMLIVLLPFVTPSI